MTCNSHLHERVERNLAMSLNSKKQNQGRNPSPSATRPLLLIGYWKFPAIQQDPLVL